MTLVRYGIPAALILTGFVLLFAAPERQQAEAWALFTGAGLSVLLLNVLHRMGVSGDEERSREDAAREHFAEHGEWPDEEAPRKREWRLPQNVATPESEEAARRAAEAQTEAADQAEAAADPHAGAERPPAGG